MRCLTLADLMRSRGARCWFACSPETFATVPALQRSGHDILELDAPGNAESLSAVMSHVDFGSWDWLVVDHYGWDAPQESACRALAKKILVIDDLADRMHDCDVLLDQTFGRDSADYDSLVPAECVKLLGSSYALLRPEFAAARAQSLLRRHSVRLERVLVSMGLTDHADVTSLIIEGIAQTKLPLAVDVVLGSAAPHADKVKCRAAASRGQIVVYEDPPSMASLMTNADLAFGAGGSSSWERCCLGLPSILIVVADNQKDVAANLSSASAIVSLGRADRVIAENISALLLEFNAHLARLVEISEAASAICDGRGVQRLEMRLNPSVTEDGKMAWLRAASAADVEMIYRWQIEPGTRRFMRNTEVPSLESHRSWFERRLEDGQSLFNVIIYDGIPSGTLSLDRTGSGEYEVSIVIASEFRGRGIGFAALESASRLVPEAMLRAEILQDNAGSEALFTRAGFKPSGYGVKFLESLDSRLN